MSLPGSKRSWKPAEIAEIPADEEVEEVAVETSRFGMNLLSDVQKGQKPVAFLSGDPVPIFQDSNVGGGLPTVHLSEQSLKEQKQLQQAVHEKKVTRLLQVLQDKNAPCARSGGSFSPGLLLA